MITLKKNDVVGKYTVEHQIKGAPFQVHTEFPI